MDLEVLINPDEMRSVGPVAKPGLFAMKARDGDECHCPSPTGALAATWDRPVSPQCLFPFFSFFFFEGEARGMGFGCQSGC